ncbi:MAG: chemotaxis protein CheB [Symploca sp. SIO3C6]|nr:chemotaxis protein CheB [Symploca sp. SIO3C6]NET08342.1 chemotaxis protein CheB [Symploca sp. SIO2B6]NET50475.1 chemotaxis protein CheB [Merismopedia sp. SIO2A8]
MQNPNSQSEQNQPPHFADAAFDLVAIASSAGGLQALTEVVSNLPAEFPAALVIVQHLDPRHRSLMAEILSRRTPLQVKQAQEGDCLSPGMVYIAPPNRHLLVNQDGTLSLSQTELVHFVRPSADLLFDSVAASYQARAIAVVLTGTGSDGAMGIQAIEKMGGTVIAQDEETADYFGMPGAAINSGAVDFILPLADIAPALITLVMQTDIPKA